MVELNTNGSYAKVFRGFLVVVKGGEELGKAVLDEMNCLIMTGQQHVLSKPLIVRLAQENIPIIICGDNYHPISIMLPYGHHHQFQKIVHAQIAASKVQRKRMWQQLVQLKIVNQYKVLQSSTGKGFHPKSMHLNRLAQSVLSGDPDNKEAQAARVYWQALMGNEFRRKPDGHDLKNAALNYGYTILRAACARAIVGSGLLPAIGLHHSNHYNSFCLADDLMEVFRPLVDWEVYRLSSTSIDSEVKKTMVRILQQDIRVEEKTVSVTSAIQRLSNSVAASFLNKKTQLVLPSIYERLDMAM